SGAGFSGMRFRFHGLDDQDFDTWVAEARKSADHLDRARYLELAAPSENEPPAFFGSVEDDIFRRAVNRCVEEGRMCVDEMMALDALGGTGFAGTIDPVPMAGATAPFGRAQFYVGELCTPEDSLRQFGARSVVLLDPPPVPTPAGAQDQTL